MLADLDQLDGGDLHAEVEEACPPPMRIRPGAGAVSQHARLEQHVLAELEPALAQQLEHVAVHAASGRTSAGARTPQWIRARFQGSALRS